MKRYGNLYEKICSMDNLYLAFQHAKKGKGWYKEVQQIEKRPYYYLAGLQWMLQNHLYKTSEYATFTKKDGKKEREIYKLPFFPDRIAQWAVLQVIEPQLLAYFTDDTYSAIPNKGIHAAYKKLRLAVDTVPEEMTYCLKIDCKKFYPSIDHETLKQKFRRKYKDPELLELIDEVIDSISTCPATDENIEFYRSCGNEIKIVKVNGKDFIEGVGIPIGNYFSQYDGNFFLSGFDHWIKEVKRVKHYYRYIGTIKIISRKVVKSMKEYGKVRSTKQPEQKVIDDYSVWIAENITPVTEAGTDEQPGFTGYEYDLTQYTKDEYIKMIDDRNASLEDQMTQAQEAMCEIYEMMA